ALAAGEIIAPGVVRHGLEPASESARRIVGEAAHLFRQLDQHTLGHFLGIRLLQTPLPAPTEDLGSVARDERLPRRLVGGTVPQPAKQSRTGPRGRRLTHFILRPKRRPSAILPFFRKRASVKAAPEPSAPSRLSKTKRAWKVARRQRYYKCRPF